MDASPREWGSVAVTTAPSSDPVLGDVPVHASPGPDHEAHRAVYRLVGTQSEEDTRRGLDQNPSIDLTDFLVLILQPAAK